MSLQDSTFKTAHVLDNEIIKASDFEFAFEQLVTNVSKATQMLLESNQDFVINGRVLKDTGMNVRVSPIYGVCKSTGLPFGRTEESDETIGFEGSDSGRIDILEIKGDWETFDEQQRAFNDPDTDTKTYQYVDTKKLMKPVYRVVKGVEGANVAPEVETGWVKLAEVVIRAGISQLAQDDIKNITADVAGMNNTGWTTQPAITYNIGYISDVNERFRVQHNADGTHKDDVIDIHSLNIGTGENQVNGNVLPVGASVSLPTGTIIASESIKSALTSVAAVITTIYNTYLKYGSYGFKGTLAVSSIADANNNLTKPITITAAGDGTAVIKIDGAAVLSIDSTGKLSTNGYTATASNHIVTKAVTDAISNSLSALATRVTNLENELADNYKYINKTLSRDRYDYTGIQEAFYATTENITLSGSQIIDGATPNNGDLILVKDQTNKKENGLYSYSNNSAWTRYTPFSTPSSYLHKLFVVSYGTSNNKKIFLFPNEKLNNPTTFGYDDFEFNEYVGTFDVSSNANANVNKFVMRDSDGRILVRNKDKSITDYAATRTEIDNLYGNVVGTALGTAAVGTASTFARSDHVHPMPICIACSGYANNADTVDNYHASIGNVGNTAVVRDSNGYVFATHFNMDVIAQPESFLDTACFVFSCGDNYFRYVPYCTVCNAVMGVVQSGFNLNANANLGLYNNRWNTYFFLLGNPSAFAGEIHSYGSIGSTNGNVHIDARYGPADCGWGTIYLNYYSGSGGVYFGNGSGSVVANINAYGSACFNGTVTATCFCGKSTRSDYADAAWQSKGYIPFEGCAHEVAGESKERAIAITNIVPNVGYISRIALGIYRGANGYAFGTGMISVGKNDAGTDFEDWYFPVGQGGTVITSGNIGSQSVNYANSAGSSRWATCAYNIPVCSGGQHISWGSIWICC